MKILCSPVPGLFPIFFFLYGICGNGDSKTDAKITFFFLRDRNILREITLRMKTIGLPNSLFVIENQV